MSQMRAEDLEAIEHCNILSIGLETLSFIIVCMKIPLVVSRYVTALTSCRLLKDWPPENPDPRTVASASNSAYRWTCHQCEHTWTAPPGARDAGGHHCPQCCKKVNRTTGRPLLVETNPELATEWVLHANLRTLDSITAGSDYLATWQCLLCQERYKLKVQYRVRGRGCPNLSCKSTRRLSLETIDKRKVRDSWRGVQNCHEKFRWSLLCMITLTEDNGRWKPSCSSCREDYLDLCIFHALYVVNGRIAALHVTGHLCTSMHELSVAPVHVMRISVSDPTWQSTMHDVLQSLWTHWVSICITLANVLAK